MREANKQEEAASVTSVRVEGDVMWGFCPECGCEEYDHDGFLGEGFRFCATCGQEWWTDIDYSSVVAKNATAERATEELVKQAQALGLYQHNDEAQPTGWLRARKRTR